MVFKSGLVTRLKSISSWLPLNKHIYAQPFRKDNINSITSILSRGPTSLLSSLSPWKYWFLILPLQFFFHLLYILIQTVIQDWTQTGLCWLTHEPWLFGCQTLKIWPCFHLNSLFSVFIQHWSYSSSERSSYIYTWLATSFVWPWDRIRTQTLVPPSN